MLRLLDITALYSPLSLLVSPAPHRMQIASQIAQALLYLHSQATPIIHGDLKPANILLREDSSSGSGSSSGGSGSGSSRTRVTALVSDAGLPLLLTGFKGTAGYIDPYQVGGV